MVMVTEAKRSMVSNPKVMMSLMKIGFKTMVPTLRMFLTGILLVDSGILLVVSSVRRTSGSHSLVSLDSFRGSDFRGSYGSSPFVSPQDISSSTHPAVSHSVHPGVLCKESYPQPLQKSRYPVGPQNTPQSGPVPEEPSHQKPKHQTSSLQTPLQFTPLVLPSLVPQSQPSSTIASSLQQSLPSRSLQHSSPRSQPEHSRPRSGTAPPSQQKIYFRQPHTYPQSTLDTSELQSAPNASQLQSESQLPSPFNASHLANDVVTKQNASMQYSQSPLLQQALSDLAQSRQGLPQMQYPQTQPTQVHQHPLQRSPPHPTSQTYPQQSTGLFTAPPSHLPGISFNPNHTTLSRLERPAWIPPSSSYRPAGNGPVPEVSGSNNSVPQSGAIPQSDATPYETGVSQRSKTEKSISPFRSSSLVPRSGGVAPRSGPSTSPTAPRRGSNEIIANPPRSPVLLYGDTSSYEDFFVQFANSRGFRFEAWVGKGAAGHVMVARVSKSTRRVAIKIPIYTTVRSTSSRNADAGGRGSYLTFENESNARAIYREYSILRSLCRRIHAKNGGSSGATSSGGTSVGANIDDGLPFLTCRGELHWDTGNTNIVFFVSDFIEGGQTYLEKLHDLSGVRHEVVKTIEGDETAAYTSTINSIKQKAIHRALRTKGLPKLPPEMVNKLAKDVGNTELVQAYLRHVSHYSSQLLKIRRVLGENGVWHRDLKPENILVEKGTQRLKLIDFGLAVDMTNQDISKGFRANFGTLGFVSPFHIDRDPKSYTDSTTMQCIVDAIGFPLTADLFEPGRSTILNPSTLSENDALSELPFGYPFNPALGGATGNAVSTSSLSSSGVGSSINKLTVSGAVGVSKVLSGSANGGKSTSGLSSGSGVGNGLLGTRGRTRRRAFSSSGSSTLISTASNVPVAMDPDTLSLGLLTLYSHVSFASRKKIDEAILLLGFFYNLLHQSRGDILEQYSKILLNEFGAEVEELYAEDLKDFKEGDNVCKVKSTITEVESASAKAIVASGPDQPVSEVKSERFAYGEDLIRADFLGNAKAVGPIDNGATGVISLTNGVTSTTTSGVGIPVAKGVGPIVDASVRVQPSRESIEIVGTAANDRAKSSISIPLKHETSVSGSGVVLHSRTNGTSVDSSGSSSDSGRGNGIPPPTNADIAVWKEFLREGIAAEILTTFETSCFLQRQRPQRSPRSMIQTVYPKILKELQRQANNRKNNNPRTYPQIVRDVTEVRMGKLRLTKSYIISQIHSIHIRYKEELRKAGGTLTNVLTKLHQGTKLHQATMWQQGSVAQGGSSLPTAGVVPLASSSVVPATPSSLLLNPPSHLSIRSSGGVVAGSRIASGVSSANGLPNGLANVPREGSVSSDNSAVNAARNNILENMSRTTAETITSMADLSLPGDLRVDLVSEAITALSNPSEAFLSNTSDLGMIPSAWSSGASIAMSAVLSGDTAKSKSTGDVSPNSGTLPNDMDDCPGELLNSETSSCIDPEDVVLFRPSAPLPQCTSSPPNDSATSSVASTGSSISRTVSSVIDSDVTERDSAAARLSDSSTRATRRHRSVAVKAEGKAGVHPVRAKSKTVLWSLNGVEIAGDESPNDSANNAKPTDNDGDDVDGSPKAIVTDSSKTNSTSTTNMDGNINSTPADISFKDEEPPEIGDKRTDSRASTTAAYGSPPDKSSDADAVEPNESTDAEENRFAASSTHSFGDSVAPGRRDAHSPAPERSSTAVGGDINDINIIPRSSSEETHSQSADASNRNKSLQHTPSFVPSSQSVNDEVGTVSDDFLERNTHAWQQGIYDSFSSKDQVTHEGMHDQIARNSGRSITSASSTRNRSAFSIDGSKLLSNGVGFTGTVPGTIGDNSKLPSGAFPVLLSSAPLSLHRTNGALHLATRNPDGGPDHNRLQTSMNPDSDYTWERISMFFTDYRVRIGLLTILMVIIIIALGILMCLNTKKVKLKDVGRGSGDSPSSTEIRVPDKTTNGSRGSKKIEKRSCIKSGRKSKLANLFKKDYDIVEDSHLLYDDYSNFRSSVRSKHSNHLQEKESQEDVDAKSAYNSVNNNPSKTLGGFGSLALDIGTLLEDSPATSETNVNGDGYKAIATTTNTNLMIKNPEVLPNRGNKSMYGNRIHTSKEGHVSITPAAHYSANFNRDSSKKGRDSLSMRDSKSAGSSRDFFKSNASSRDNLVLKSTKGNPLVFNHLGLSSDEDSIGVVRSVDFDIGVIQKEYALK